MCEFLVQMRFLCEQLEGNRRQPRMEMKLLKEIHKQPMKMLHTIRNVRKGTLHDESECICL